MPVWPNKKWILAGLSLALAFALSLPSAEAHRGGRGGRGGGGEGRDGRNGGEGREGSTRNEGPRYSGSAYKFSSSSAKYSYGGGNEDDDDDKKSKSSEEKKSSSSKKEDDSAYVEPSSAQVSSDSANAAAEAESKYHYEVAEYYRAASSKTRALGIVTTAEGLGKMLGQGIKIGEGDTLVAAGLDSLQASDEFKQSEEAVMSNLHESASPKEVDQELISDPLAEEVIAGLAEKTGYSQAEVIEKILASEGSLDSLAREFEAAALRKIQISQADRRSKEEANSIVEGSKSGALRRKVNFSSLRNALAASAPVAKPDSLQDWKVQWSKAASVSPKVMVKAEPQAIAKAPAAARAPASQPEFANLGENLPSFELEQSQSAPAEEASLFEKVHRKYTEIAPSMRRPN